MKSINFQAWKVGRAILTILLIPSVSWATTYYVSTGGSDTNTGTSTTPWKTIQKAADTMVAGDTVDVQAGTYNEQVTIKTSGSAGASITFKSNGTAQMLGFISNANYIVIDGFSISNSFSETWTANGIYIKGAYNIVQNNYIHDLRYQGIQVGDENDNAAHHDNIVRGNKIYKAGQSGIDVGGRNNLIENNEISHTLQHPPGGDVTSSPDADADGIYFFGSEHVIRGNKVFHLSCSDAGNTNPHIDCFQTWGPAKNIIIEQNICDNADAYTGGGCTPHAGMIEESTNGSVSDLLIRNNIIKAQVGFLIHDAERTSVVNNTFKGRILNDGLWTVGVELETSPNSKVQNNLFYDVGQNKDPYLNVDDSSLVGSAIGYNCHYMSNSQSPAGSPYPNDIWQQNPQLVNVSGDDFSLQSSSPLIDKGITLSEVKNDFRNTSRPFGNGFDIGAYEFTNSIPPPAAPTNLSAQTSP